MNFWELFADLCAEKGQSPTTTLEKLGLSKGNASRWKRGGGPSLTTATRIANYLEVPLDRLSWPPQSTTK